jgi:hypothetical protein
MSPRRRWSAGDRTGSRRGGGQAAAPAFDLYMRGLPPTGQGRWKWQRKKVRAEARREGLAMHAGRGER